MNTEKQRTCSAKSRDTVKGVAWPHTLSTRNILNGLAFLLRFSQLGAGAAHAPHAGKGLGVPAQRTPGGRRRRRWASRQPQPLFVPGGPARPPVRLCVPAGGPRRQRPAATHKLVCDKPLFPDTAETRQASPSRRAPAAHRHFGFRDSPKEPFPPHPPPPRARSKRLSHASPKRAVKGLPCPGRRKVKAARQSPSATAPQPPLRRRSPRRRSVPHRARPAAPPAPRHGGSRGRDPLPAVSARQREGGRVSQPRRGEASRAEPSRAAAAPACSLGGARGASPPFAALPTCPLESGAPTSATECACLVSWSPASACLQRSRAKPLRRAMTQEPPSDARRRRRPPPRCF